MKNLWLLTEERPKKEVIKTIFCKFAEDNAFGVFVDTIRIIPILNNGNFTFTYEVKGLDCSAVKHIYIKTISGISSFTDFLVFYQDDEPTINDVPIYAIEETKTDDSESRNTGVYQRSSKFIFIQNYYPTAKQIMLYNLQVPQKEKSTDSYIFGTRLLLTLGIEILGKKLDPKTFTPFKTIDEIIDFKDNMRKAHRNNIPISISKSDCSLNHKITISGRLYKNNGLNHDPNIGALSLISAALRKLGWKDKIEITQHGLEQKHICANKFIQIANKLDVSLNELSTPKVDMSDIYWKYETRGEKLGTIFIHLVVENFANGFSIFENHAGCEKGYFITSDREHIPLEKYTNREKYKAGDKSQIIHIPDLVLIDLSNLIIIDIEGKQYRFRAKGIEELTGYDAFDRQYVKKYYPKHKIIRTVVLYGSKEEQIIEIEVGFLLNENGKLILGIRAPKLFQEAVKNLLDYWKN